MSIWIFPNENVVKVIIVGKSTLFGNFKYEDTLFYKGMPLDLLKSLLSSWLPESRILTGVGRSFAIYSSRPLSARLMKSIRDFVSGK